MYALIGAAICSLDLSLLAAIFPCYRCRKTTIVVLLSLSRQLQTTILGGITSYRPSELETACEDLSNVIGQMVRYPAVAASQPGQRVLLAIIGREVKFGESKVPTVVCPLLGINLLWV